MQKVSASPRNDYQTSYSLLETLLLCSQVVQYGETANAFSLISTALQANPLLTSSPSFELGRLSPDALRERWIDVAREEGFLSRSVSPVHSRGQTPDRKRRNDVPIHKKTATANGMLLVGDEVVRNLTRRLMDRYRTAMASAIKDDEVKISKYSKEIGDLQVRQHDEAQKKARIEEAELKKTRRRSLTPKAPLPVRDAATQIEPKTPAPLPSRPSPSPGSAPLSKILSHGTPPPEPSPEAAPMHKSSSRNGYTVDSLLGDSALQLAPAFEHRPPRIGTFTDRRSSQYSSPNMTRRPSDDYAQTYQSPTAFADRNILNPVEQQQYYPPPLPPIQHSPRQYADRQSPLHHSPLQHSPRYPHGSPSSYPAHSPQAGFGVLYPPGSPYQQQQPPYSNRPSPVVPQFTPRQYSSPLPSPQYPPQYPPYAAPYSPSTPFPPSERPRLPPINPAVLPPLQFTPAATAPPRPDRASSPERPRPEDIEPLSEPDEPEEAPRAKNQRTKKEPVDKEMLDEEATLKAQAVKKPRVGRDRRAEEPKVEYVEQEVEVEVMEEEEEEEEKLGNKRRPTRQTTGETVKRNRTEIPDSQHNSSRSVTAEEETEPATPHNPPPQFPGLTGIGTPSSTQTRQFGKLALPVMDRLASHKFASLFGKPVNAVQVPKYYKQIYQPQDIKSIKAALKAGQSLMPSTSTPTPTNEFGPSNSYTTAPSTPTSTSKSAITKTSQLEKEILRMFANACMFNKSLSGPAQEAIEMSEAAEDILENFREAEKAGERRQLAQQQAGLIKGHSRRDSGSFNSGFGGKAADSEEETKVKKRKPRRRELTATEDEEATDEEAELEEEMMEDEPTPPVAKRGRGNAARARGKKAISLRGSESVEMSEDELAPTKGGARVRGRARGRGRA